MPRNVRPAWIALDIDGRRSPFAAGPRARGGWLAGSITLRTDTGGVSEPVSISAGGADRETGAARLELTIPPGWSVDYYPAPRDDKARRTITIRPPARPAED